MFLLKLAFFLQAHTGTSAGRRRTLNSTLGELTITSQQAQRLHLPSHRRCTPLLQKCCLLLTANESYQRAEVDLSTLTGITVLSFPLFEVPFSLFKD